VQHPRACAARRIRAGIWVALLLAPHLACAAKQRIALDCVPERVTIYVDREALDAGTDTVELRIDEPHQIYVKGPGYEPQLIVLEPRVGEDGRTRLHPENVCVELVRVGVDRELTLEAEHDPEAPPPEDTQR